MSKFWRTVLLVLAAADGLVLLPIVINYATGGEAPAWLKPYEGWIWPLVGLLAVTAIVFTVLQSLEKRPEGRIAGYVHPDFRSRAIANIRRYVTQRLDQSLVRVARARLDLDAVSDAVGAPPRTWHVTRGEDPWEPPPGASPLDVYDHLDGSMLILGSPGAGKTTMILELAEALLARTDQPRVPLPVVVELADWAVSRQSLFRRSSLPELGDWLLRRIDSLYGIGDGVADAWLKDGRLALLLDGFDEVPEEYRARCVAGVNALYDRYPQVQIVVGSRAAEYEDLPESQRFLLRGAVVIRPLTSEQVLSYLSQGEGRLRLAHQAVDDDPALLGLITAPLWLYVLIVASNSSGATAPDRDALLSSFVDQVLKLRRNRRRRYPPAQVLTWITQVARLMTSTNRRTLAGPALVGTELSWWTALDRPTQRMINGVVVPIAVGIWSAIVAGKMVGSVGIGWSLAGGLVLAGSGVFVLVASGLEGPPRWTAGPPLSRVRAGVAGVVLGAGGGALIYAADIMMASVGGTGQKILFGALGVVSAGSAIYALGTAGDDSDVRAAGVALALGLVCVVFALLTGDPAGHACFMLGLWIGVPLAFVLANRDESSPPTGEVSGGGKVFVVTLTGAVIGIAIGAAYAETGTVSFFGGMGAVGLLAAGVVTSVVPSYMIFFWVAGLGGWIVQAVLGRLPFRYRAFISHATDIGLLQRDGKSYRFPHVILSDHLAKGVVPPPERSSTE
ncbi:hypothetical protein FDA94_18045 [Herbidospora galbida]|uniref:NACHT domain-containing protein n=1 Tax=Herbidospora galbida TaxID=2575442 RepID=A0A4U3MFA3_9ACTN|nr:hypothetical protein [Herbidospora galbida]TKK87400.1 hypothetical protein FDA94_18045 [Herbidospora galbida]